MSGSGRDSSEQSAARFLRLRAKYEEHQAARHLIRGDDGLFERVAPRGDRGTLSVVEEVLRSSGRPMSVREIAAAAGARLPTRSTTPDTVVARDLSIDIKRLGDLSRFARTSPGRYVLRPAPPAPPSATQDSGSLAEPGITHRPEDGTFEAELRQRRDERRRARRAEEVRLFVVPAQWRFVEKHAPGAWASWVSGVGLPSESFSLGITGKPSIVVATHLQCRHDSSCECRIFEYGGWKMRSRTV